MADDPPDHGAVPEPGSSSESAGRDRFADRFSEIYEDLHRIARNRMRDDPANTLQATALIHEAFLKMAGSERVPEDRGHFFAIAAQALRHALVEHHRAKTSLKRGGQLTQHPLESASALLHDSGIEAVAIHDLLESLSSVDPMLVTIVDLKFFAGCTMSEIAELTGLSKRDVERRWTSARALLKVQLEPGS